MKACLYCVEQIQDAATVCHHCGNSQMPGAVSRGGEDAAERTVKLVDFIVRWFGIPLMLIVAAASFFGLKEIDALRKTLADTKETAAMFRSAEDSLGMLLSRTINLETTQLLDRFPLDSELSEFRDRVAALSGTVDALETFNRRTSKNVGDRDLRLAKALSAYKDGNFGKVLMLLDKPYDRGLWEHHLRGAAFFKKKQYKESAEELRAMAVLTPLVSTARRIERNLAIVEAELGNLDGAIRRMETVLKVENSATGRVNLAAMLARRGENERAIKELQSGFELGFCASIESLKREDSGLNKLANDPKYRKQVEDIVARRGEC